MNEYWREILLARFECIDIELKEIENDCDKPNDKPEEKLRKIGIAVCGFRSDFDEARGIIKNEVK